jgi:hypothetical protein
VKPAELLLTPEARLLFRTLGGPGAVSIVTEGSEAPLEWQRLLELAHRERAALPLWRLIRDSPLATVPEATHGLKRMAQIWEFKLLHLERLLFQVVDAFAKAGVDVVLLKGAAAGLSVYPSLSQRPMLDIDVLVAEGEAERAWALARSLGWKWDEESFPREAYRDAHHLPPLQDAFGSGCGLEIHTEVLMSGNPFRFTAEDLRSRSLPVQVGGVACAVPSIEHQLLHCCIHFAWSHRMLSHAWRAFSDVGAFARSGRVDWDEFVRLAGESQAETCAFWTLRLAERATGVEIPGAVLAELEPAGAGYVREALERHYLINLLPDGEKTPSLALEERLWRLGIQRGPAADGIHLPSAPEPKRLGERLRYHSQRLPHWYRYFKRLV